MGPTPQAPQNVAPMSPKVRAASPASQQVHAYSTSGSGPQVQNPQEAHLVNLRLIEELRSVVIMNDKWQKYNKQQDKFVSELQVKLDKQKLTTEDIERKYSHAIITNNLQENKIKDQEATINCFGSLMDDLEQARIMIKEQENELKKFQQKKVDTQQLQSTPEGTEKIQILQFQLQMCIDDFQKEEKERMRLLRETSSLSTKLMEANSLLEEFRQKVNIMKSISFPTIHMKEQEANVIPSDKIHRRRNRMSTSTSSKSNGMTRLDGMFHFPSMIEADDICPSPRGFELAPTFSSSLESEEADSDDQLQQSDEDCLELARH